MTTRHVHYFVSADPDRITWPEYNRDHMVGPVNDPPHYQTPEDAVDAIKADAHGGFGPLYVIKAELEVVATADRGWELRRKES